MATTGRDRAAIPRYGFNPPDALVADFEITDLVALHRRVPGGLQRPHRADFHAVILVTSGTGWHTVDFVTYPCRPGTLLWVRPGQVQHFAPPSAMDGPQLLFTTAFPPPFPDAERVLGAWYPTSCWQLGTSPAYATLATLTAQLRAEYRGAASPEILRLLLGALLLHIDRLPPPHAGQRHQATSEVYARFRAELEQHYATTRRAEDYAARLGYSVKTLTRACLDATGQPVKQVIDARVALQAQRLLAHTGEPVASIARRLGFTEPTNFGKFFARQTGSAPGEFRRAQHDVRAASTG